MGPMTAALHFVEYLAEFDQTPSIARIHRVQVDLYGSLALTGIGHATDRAILLGLSGNFPAKIDPADMESLIAKIRSLHVLKLNGTHPVAFDESTDLVFHRDTMFPPDSVTKHPNGMRFKAFDEAGSEVESQTWFSIGGGFVVSDGDDVPAPTQFAYSIP